MEFRALWSGLEFRDSNLCTKTAGDRITTHKMSESKAINFLIRNQIKNI